MAVLPRTSLMPPPFPNQLRGGRCQTSLPLGGGLSGAILGVWSWGAMRGPRCCSVPGAGPGRVLTGHLLGAGRGLVRGWVRVGCSAAGANPARGRGPGTGLAEPWIVASRLLVSCFHTGQAGSVVSWEPCASQGPACFSGPHLLPCFILCQRQREGCLFSAWEP